MYREKAMRRQNKKLAIYSSGKEASGAASPAYPNPELLLSKAPNCGICCDNMHALIHKLRLKSHLSFPLIKI